MAQVCLPILQAFSYYQVATTVLNFKAKHSGTQRAASTKHRVSFVRRFGVRIGSSVFRKAAAIGCTKIGTYLFGRGTSLSRWKRDAAYSVPSC